MPPYYCQVEVEVQAPLLASVDTQGGYSFFQLSGSGNSPPTRPLLPGWEGLEYLITALPMVYTDTKCGKWRGVYYLLADNAQMMSQLPTWPSLTLSQQRS